MKPTLIAAILAISTIARAGNAPSPTPTPAPQWNVRADLLVVDMPQARALALLSDLHDPMKVNAATMQILAAVDRGEATLIAYPTVQATDGATARSEPVTEKRYATQYQLPTDARLPRMPGTPTSPEGVALPTAFETRNIGFQFTMTPQVLEDGRWISIYLMPDHVAFPRTDTFVDQINQPLFTTIRTQTTLAVHNGQRTLIAFDKIPGTDNLIELSILQAWAEPIK